MISAYNEIVNYSGDDWDDFFTRICIIDIFKPLLTLFKDKVALGQAIRYIVWCYSKNSDCFHLGADWYDNKKRIYAKAMLPDIYKDDLLELENSIVVKVINKWIDFQDSAVFAQLISLRELQLEMRLSCNTVIKKSSGETDYDQKFKNAQYVKELGKIIDELEQELIQNIPTLKQAARELKIKTKNTIGVESFAN